MFDDEDLQKETRTEMIYLGPDDIEVMNQFAVTVIVVPATGRPAALVHIGLAPLNDLEDKTKHNIALTKNQVQSVIEDFQKVHHMLENM